MRSYRLGKLFLALLSSGVFCSVTACRRDTQSGQSDSVQTVAAEPTTSPVVPANTGWDEKSAGEFMLLPASDDGITAGLVMPNETDSSLAKAASFNVEQFANAAVDLFNRAGTAGSSSVAINSQLTPTEGCLVWPGVRLVSKPATAWTVGFASGRAKSIKADSVEGLSQADSLGVTTELVKQASALSMNGDPAFRGLPFIVQKAYRLSMGDTTALVGSVVRKINEEANPREEHFLIILERSSSNAPYSVAYQNRSAGSEDAVRTSAMLAAVRFVRTNQAALVISFEYDDGGQVALLEHSPNRSWKVTWRSAYTGC